MIIEEYFNRIVLGNTIEEYVTALAVAIIIFSVLGAIRLGLKRKIQKIKSSDKNKDLQEALMRGGSWGLVAAIAVYSGAQLLTFPQIWNKWINYAFIIIFAFFAVRIALKLVDYSKKKLIHKKSEEDESVIKFLSILTKGLLWLIAGLVVLSNMGVNITALVAGLGVAGIAVAFALQSVLEDLFASVSIYFDKPFKKGDFVILENNTYLGTVEYIGMKTTRITSLSGEEIVISNKELTSTKIRNYKRMEKRRVAFSIGVIYQTPLTKVKKIPTMVKNIFKKIKNIELDRVHFKEFGDSSLNYEIVYYIGTNDYNVYMDIQQKINFSLMQQFQKEGIEFAYPTRTIFLED